MSVKDAILTHLLADSDVTDLVGTRIWLAQAPAKPTRPYVVFQRTDYDPETCFDGAAGLKHEVYGFDAYAESAVSAENIMEKIRSSLGVGNARSGFGTETIQTIMPEDVFDGYVQPEDGGDVGLYWIGCTFKITAGESVPTL